MSDVPHTGGAINPPGFAAKRWPDFEVFVVNDEAPDGEMKWRKVGAAWKHHKGGGYQIILKEGVSVSGKLVCLPPREG